MAPIVAELTPPTPLGSTAAKPDKLVVVDRAARKVEKTCDIPDPGTGVLTLVPSPDADHWENVSGIDIDTC